MTSRRTLAVYALLAAAAGCTGGTSTTGSGAGSSAAPGSATEDTGAPKHAGVWPDKFQCDSIATVDTLTALLGGTVTRAGTIASVPDGIAKPCAYDVTMAPPTDLAPDALPPAPESWSFDMDCTNSYKQTADLLFVQYAQMAASRIAGYNRASDAGIPPNDAGIVNRAPGAATVVDVGAKGLDHNDSSILFIDDDAPCYVRVNGPDAPRRLLLAKLVAKNLTYVNAPMELRPLK